MVPDQGAKVSFILAFKAKIHEISSGGLPAMTIDWTSFEWGRINIRVTAEGESIAVKGDTYGIKEDLKPLGARFRGADKAWVLPNTPKVFEGLKQVVAKHAAKKTGGAADDRHGGVLPPMNLRPSSAAPPPRTLSSPVSGRSTPPSSDAAAHEPEDLTIAAFVARVDEVLRQQFPQTIWLVGEIQNLGVRRTATYFQLAEPKDGGMTSTTAVSALIWASKAALIRRSLGAELYDKVLTEGMQVRVQCQVRLYKDRGSLSLTVMAIDPAYSEGVLALQRQKVLKALRAKGIAQHNQQLRPPLLPLRIGLISAADSRAINDFLHQLFQYGFPGRVIVHHASMQGDKTSPEVRLALKKLSSIQPPLDAIVITRGGGSAADLRFFDDEALGEAICLCPVPVIAAIGHHDDRSVAEEVAFRREKTPTAAAVYLLQALAQVREFLADSAQKIARETRRHLMRRDDQLQVAASAIKQATSSRLAAQQLALGRCHSGLKIASQNRLHGHQQQLSVLTRRFGEQLSQFHFGQLARLHALASRLPQAAADSLTRRQAALTRTGHGLKARADAQFYAYTQQLADFEAELTKNDPEEWRKRGLVRLTTTKGKVLRSVTEVAEGDALSARLCDGVLDVTVEAKRPTGQGQVKS